MSNQFADAINQELSKPVTPKSPVIRRAPVEIAEKPAPVQRSRPATAPLTKAQMEKVQTILNAAMKTIGPSKDECLLFTQLEWHLRHALVHCDLALKYEFEGEQP